jgi:type IV pilus assembly protein PilN
MIRVNLLPHREEKRKARRQQFYALSGLVTVLAGVIWFFGFTIISGYISTQDSKNAFLKAEIEVLDKDIEEIKKLREQTDALLSRKRVIESLQANRTETVHLFNELARRVPSGIYLKGIKQAGQKVSLVGYTQTNTRVSTLMHNLDESPVLERPELVEIKATTIDKRRLGEFSLDVYLVRQTTDNKGKSASAKSAVATPLAPKKDQKP